MCCDRLPPLSWLRLWVLAAVRPSLAADEIGPREPELLPAACLALGSSLLFVSGVFLAGGAVYHVFVEQYSTFLLERLTGTALFGLQPSRYAYARVFLEGSAFVVKLWLALGLLAHLIGRALGLPGGLRATLVHLSWSVFPQSWLLVALALAARVLRWVLPDLHGHLYYLGLAAALLVLAPVTLQRLRDAGNERTAGQALASGAGRLYGAYYGALFVLFLLWTYNHPALALLRVL